MSLLMDALKKAEQEKKEAARRLKETQEKTGEQIKLQTEENADISSPSGMPAASATAADQTGASDIAGAVKSRELSLVDETGEKNNESIILSKTDPGSEKRDTASLLLEDATIEHDDMSDDPHGNNLDDEIKPPQGHDKTFALTADLSMDAESAVPFDDTEDNTIKEKLTETLSGSRSFKTVISAAELARDIGGITREAPTPVAAQTVFTAVGGVSGKRKIMEWVAFIGLFAIILTAAGAFYYLKITPLTPEISSPLVAQGVEADVSPAFIVPLPLEETHEPGIEAPQDTAVIAEMPAEEIKETVPPEIAAVEAEQAVMPENVDSKPVVAETSNVPAGDIAEVQQALPEKIQVDESAITISRTRTTDKKDQMINTAYSEYGKANYAVAEAAYLGVLEEMPENRDALLGMAAIAWRKGNIQGAYEYYLKVLKLYPKDAVAATGLISLQGYTDPVKNESMIKIMLREQPEAGFLHFALGNTYASQSRWPEAQQAFFEAFRMQPENPDYAYNLAVSLDQIGQSRTAMDYYRKALELADNTQVSFNTANVLARVNDLAQTSQ